MAAHGSEYDYLNLIMSFGAPQARVCSLGSD